MPLFDRTARIEIASPDNLNMILTTLKGFRITFNITKFSNISLNKANIEIYNLKESTRNSIKEIQDVVTLHAGYVRDSGEEIIFSGNISIINQSKSKTEFITKLQCNSGEKSINETMIDVSYGAGAKAKNILKDILKEIPISTKIINEDSLGQDEFYTGFSYIGNVKKALNMLAYRLELTITFNDNEIILYNKYGDDTSEVVHLSSSTGLLESPEKVNNLIKDKSSTEKKTGWKIKSLLRPSLHPGGRVSLMSNAIPEGSIFNIYKVNHKGDTHGADWITECEVFV